jgi:hypothetical protein
MRFREAVEAVPELETFFKKGLHALTEADRNRIHCSKPRNLAGSINVDVALREALPHDPRWDYGIGYRTRTSRERAIWVEVHPASSQSINDILTKLNWLQQWLSNKATDLREITDRFIWISSGKVALTPGSPQRKRIAAAGIEFVGRKLVLA